MRRPKPASARARESDNEEITSSENSRRLLSAQPTSSNRQPQTVSRQLRSRTILRPSEGKAAAAKPQNTKRHVTAKSRALPRKRRAHFRHGGRRAQLARAEPDGDESEDEGAEAAPDDSKFWAMINEHTGATGDTALRALRLNDEPSDLMQAGGQLQNETRDYAQETDREHRFQSEDKSEATSRQQQKKIKPQRQKAAQKLRAKSYPLRNSQQRRARSVDLGSDAQAADQAIQSQAPPEKERTGNEDLVQHGEDVVAGEPQSEGVGSGADSEEDETDGEGTIILDLPQDSEAPEVIHVDSDELRLMLETMGRPGWAQDRGYAKALLSQQDEAETWLWQRNEEKLEANRCQPLYCEIYQLLKLYQGMPKVSEVEAQVGVPEASVLTGQIGYLREHEVAIEGTLNAIHALVKKMDGSVGKHMANSVPQAGRGSRWANDVVESLCRRIIPMLVLCLKGAFLMGGSAEADAALPPKGQFMACTLQPLLLMTEWIQRLYKTLNTLQPIITAEPRQGQSESTVPEKSRGYLRKHVEAFHLRVEQAALELKRYAGARERIVETRKKDEAIQAATQEKRRRLQEAEDRQMRLVAEFTKRLRSETERDAYFEQRGWHLDEDAQLLDAVRKPTPPQIHALMALVPGRRADEVTRRMGELKAEARRKYEDAGMVPPLWCYDGDAKGT